MMTDYDKERLYTLRKERDNATKHLCPRVAAASSVNGWRLERKTLVTQ